MRRNDRLADRARIGAAVVLALVGILVPTSGANARPTIINGEVVQGNIDHTGIVLVQSDEGKCTGTLMKNLAVLTARHCVADYEKHPGEVMVSMGGQWTVGRTIVLHPEVDVAIVVLADRLSIWVDGQLSFSDYSRGIVNVPNQDLHKKLQLCAGYGWGYPGGGSGILRYAGLTLEDQGVFGLVVTHANDKGQIGAPGDSGAPCLDGFSTVSSPISVIQTSCGGWSYSDPPDVCWHESPEGWADWAILVLSWVSN